VFLLRCGIRVELLTIVIPHFQVPYTFLKSIAGKKNKVKVFTHELVNDLGKEIKEMIFTRELLDKLGQI